MDLVHAVHLELTVVPARLPRAVAQVIEITLTEAHLDGGVLARQTRS